MGLRRFERKLEALVEGAFARAFKANVRPIELGRRLAREMDDHRTLGVSGGDVAPNQFTIRLNDTDHDELEGVMETLRRQLAEAAREHARDEGYRFLGPVDVELAVDPNLRTGVFQVEPRMVEAPGGIAVDLVLPNGERLTLGDQPVVIGRLPECDVTLPDSNVSRSHARITRGTDAWLVEDLGSTNGTKVNGVTIGEPRRLEDGDEITIGPAVLQVEAG